LATATIYFNIKIAARTCATTLRTRGARPAAACWHRATAGAGRCAHSECAVARSACGSGTLQGPIEHARCSAEDTYIFCKYTRPNAGRGACRVAQTDAHTCDAVHIFDGAVDNMFGTGTVGGERQTLATHRHDASHSRQRRWSCAPPPPRVEACSALHVAPATRISTPNTAAPPWINHHCI
jgi:hypothetical protein